ncbi:MAG: YhcH/YjgK/YiaL family protein [Parabacteroides sp.]|nr:YhcH/YjgK/YiaL family protein [Parabacteroides sp.]
MNIKKTIVYTILMIAMMACQTKKDVSDWTDSEINEWFSASAWNTELKMKPDESINKRAFVEQNVMNPQSWEVAFKFLKETDLNALELGRHDLSDDGTYANVEEYLTKDSAHFEAHRKYIDIQYLATGKEYIFVTPMEPEKQVETQAYDEQRDIEFFDKEEYTPHLLSPDNFMVFFPEDGHKPCMKVDTNETVKKVVV